MTKASTITNKTPGLIQRYYALTKPGIIYGNIVTATAGFLLASKGKVDSSLLLATLGGLSLVIASACVINNYTDRGIDNKMARTKGRALVKGSISASAALVYAVILGAAGFSVLAIFTNWLSFAVAFAGFFSYVVLYGVFKRRSVHGTVVGSIAGAVPPVVGYCAVTNHFDGGAALLFLILVFWQMPHFYAIAMYRFDDYKSAGLPVLPVKKGMKVTKTYMLAYIIAFCAAALLLTVLGYTGYVYTAATALAGLGWLWFWAKGIAAADDKLWARKMFFFSLIVILSWSIFVSLDAWLA